MAQALPFIPRKYVKKSGCVDLWDMDVESGGPVKIERQAIIAREALSRDPGRFKLDLPRGTKPGPAQVEAEQRAAEEAAEAAREADLDPVYGRRNQQ